MSVAWDAYVQKYGKNPDSSDQLMKFSKTYGGKALNFKEAKDLYNSYSGKGKSSPSLNSQKPLSQPPPPVQQKQKQEEPEQVEEPEEEKQDNNNANPLFAQLNKGGDITKGLNKVTSDMKTKNQPNRSGKVIIDENIKPKIQPKSQEQHNDKIVKKEPSITKKGFRLIAENYTEGLQQFDEADVKSEIYITNCTGGGFMVANKVKGVTIDKCNKIQVEIHEVVSTIELVNCKNVTVYIKKTAPSILLDKCEQPILFIFQEALDKNPNIISSMVQDLNIEIPPEQDDADTVEIAIPYQFITTIDPKTKKSYYKTS